MQTINKIPGMDLVSETIQGGFCVDTVRHPKPGLIIMKVIYSILFEQFHRYVFDNYYVQEYQITWFNKLVLFFYHTGFKIHPKWRCTLKEYFGPCTKYDRYLHSYFKPYKFHNQQ